MAGAFLGSDLWLSEYITPHDIYQHGVIRVLDQRQTDFQQMYIFESASYGKALVLDGKWQTCTGDEFLYHEPLIHIPCVLHGGPKSVLIAGGADGGSLREALKWKTVERVAMVDIDGEVIEACRQHLPEIHQGAFDDPRAEVIAGDAFEYIGRQDRDWDVVIADLTDPIEEGPAYKLFTKEFFEMCRRALRPGGFFVNQAGTASPPLTNILVRVMNTVGAVFPHTTLFTSHVTTYGSPWGFALASDVPIDSRPDPDAVNALLAEKTTNSFRMFDGSAMLGLLQTPKYIREQIAAESFVYTLAEPPRFFGKGAVGED